MKKGKEIETKNGAQRHNIKEQGNLVFYGQQKPMQMAITCFVNQLFKHVFVNRRTKTTADSKQILLK